MIPAGIQVLEDGTIVGRSGRPLKPASNKAGYRRVNLYHNGKWRLYSVHVLVCETFHGPKPFQGAQVRHLDGNNQNNRADNLRWSTAAENHADKRAHGTALVGEKNHQTKLTEQQVREIRARYAAGGISQQALGAEYGVSQGTVFHIVRRVTWDHI